jgi:hypothetical protein
VTFGAINYYTQWFERLGAEPLTIIVAGLTTVAVAVGLMEIPYRTCRRSPPLAAGA